jgi:hypothetical protein
MRNSKLAILLTIYAGISYADLLVSRGPLGVDRYSNDGDFLGNLIAPGSGGLMDAQGVAVAPNGDLLVGDFAADNILRYNSAGAFLGVFSSDPAVDTPFDVVFGPDGNVYVASAGNESNVAQLNPLGGVLNPNFASGNPVTQPIGGPQYIEFGTNNVMYLTDIAGRLFRYNATTGAWMSTSFYDNPEGVAFGSDGFVYLVQRGSFNVLRIPAMGGPAQIVIPNGLFGGTPEDIEFGPNGLLYVSADQIYRFDVSGANGVLVDSFGTGGEFITFTPIPEPSSCALACLGLVVGVMLRKRV